jgi:uncharacterized protein (TIGR03435 family)
MRLRTQRNASQRLLLLAAPLLFASTAASAQVVPAPPTNATTSVFDAVTIKPNNIGIMSGGAWGVNRNEFRAKNTPLAYIILPAYLGYGATLDRLKGAPSWLTTAPYDIVAKADDAMADAWKGKRQAQQIELAAPLLRSMFEDRCKLVVHTEPTVIQAYALVIGKHGNKMKEAQPDEPKPTGNYARFDGGWMVVFPQPGDAKQSMGYRQVTMQDFTQSLSLGPVPIIDQTGLTGKYDFDLPKMDSIPPQPAPGDTSAPPPAPLPDLSRMFDWSAIGLELKPIKVPALNLVIDHIERPSEN